MSEQQGSDRKVTVQNAFGFITEPVDDLTLRYRVVGGPHAPLPSAYVMAAIITDIIPGFDTIEGWGVHVDTIPEGQSAEVSVLVWAPTAMELAAVRQKLARANITERWAAMMAALRTAVTVTATN